MKSFQRFVCCTFAVLVLGISSHARAAVFCAKTVSDLTTALSQASSNGQNNTIKIVAGTIIGGFGYSMMGSFNLDIEGGWSDDCSTRRPDAGLTILDGMSTTDSALSLYTFAGGNITVRYLTVQNYHSTANTVLMYAAKNGDLRLENCLFVHNSPASNTSQVVGLINENSGGSGSLYFLDNAAIANTMSGGGRPPVVYLQGGGSATATCNLCANNNTVSGNTLSSGTNGAVEVSGNLTKTNLANNIFWGNYGTDLYIYGPTNVLVKNDVGTEGGTTPSAGSLGNISVDPLFVNSASDNFRLRAMSPARDVGDNTPPGTIRNYDLDGLARIDVTTVDMGAYEFHDVIFANGFE